MNKTHIQLFLAMILSLPVSAFAIQIKGVDVPDNITQEATRQQLVLNGAGIRSKFIFDIYVGALYLSTRTNSVEQILAQPSPARVSMHFLYDRIERQKMTDAWSEGFEDNLDDEQLNAIASRITQFNSAFGDTVEGDVVIIDFLPDGSTVVTTNNVEKVKIDGADFQRALLAIWLGNDPVDADLKRAMLGQPEE